MRTDSLSEVDRIDIINLQEDPGAYVRLVSRLKINSVYFTPSYLLCAQKAEGYPVKVIVAYDDDDFALVPYVWRRINDLPFCKDISEEMTDIITPYEYSGVLMSSDRPERREVLLSSFCSAVDELCRERGVVTEFARFDPFITDVRMMGRHYLVRKVRQNVYLDLEKDKEGLTASFERSAQKNIRTAIRCGLHFQEGNSDRDIDIFIDLYWRSMKRLGAQKYYYFNREYFTGLLNECDGAKLFIVRDGEGAPAAASILLYGEDTAHHHLTGYAPEMLEKRPNDFMIYRLSLWAREHGIRRLHLGGGPDPIRNFKARFSSAGIPYYIGYKVHNSEKYETLCRAWSAHNGPCSDSGYFPLYRLNQ